MRLNCSIFLFLGFIQIGSICAQSQYSAEVNLYTTEQGLPSNHVYQCFQDRSGLLWLLTENGLCRFDGRNFQLVLSKGFNPDFSKNIIRFEDLDHDLWISIHAANGPTRYTLFNTVTNQVRTPEEKFGKCLRARMTFWTVSVCWKKSPIGLADRFGGIFSKSCRAKSIQRIDKTGFAQTNLRGIYFVDTTGILVDVTTHGEYQRD